MVPLPPAPPDTLSVKLVGAGTNVADMARSRSIVTWQTAMVLDVGHAGGAPLLVQLEHRTVGRRRGEAHHRAGRVGDACRCPWRPRRPWRPTMAQLMPPRLEAILPLAELLPVPMVS